MRNEAAGGPACGGFGRAAGPAGRRQLHKRPVCAGGLWVCRTAGILQEVALALVLCGACAAVRGMPCVQHDRARQSGARRNAQRRTQRAHGDCAILLLWPCADGRLAFGSAVRRVRRLCLCADSLPARIPVRFPLSRCGNAAVRMHLLHAAYAHAVYGKLSGRRAHGEHLLLQLCAHGGFPVRVLGRMGPETAGSTCRSHGGRTRGHSPGCGACRRAAPDGRTDWIQALRTRGGGADPAGRRIGPALAP